MSIAGVFLMQLFPFHNNKGVIKGVNFIENAVPLNDSVLSIMEKACFDCHSNKTTYPWYTFIQPFGWLINQHVLDAKKELNFSEFNNYSLKRKLHKFKEIDEMISENEMPLESYTWIHKEAVLSAQEKQILIDWALASKNYLTDSVK